MAVVIAFGFVSVFRNTERADAGSSERPYFHGTHEDEIEELASVFGEEARYWKSFSTGYFFNQLSDEEKFIYVLFDYCCMSVLLDSDSDFADYRYYYYIGAFAYEYDAYLTTFENIRELIWISNPQYFFLGDRFFSGWELTHEGEGENQKTYFSKIEICMYAEFSTASKRTLARKKVKKRLDDYLEEVPEGRRPEECEKIIHDTICQNIAYGEVKGEGAVFGAPLDQSIYSALCLNTTVCCGYAKLFEALMNHLGVPCLFATNTYYYSETERIGHAWNIVNLHGFWYCMDVTHDDYSDYDGIHYDHYNCSELIDGIGRKLEHDDVFVLKMFPKMPGYDELCEGESLKGYSPRYFTKDGKTYFIVNDIVDDGVGLLAYYLDADYCDRSSVNYNGQTYKVSNYKKKPTTSPTPVTTVTITPTPGHGSTVTPTPKEPTLTPTSTPGPKVTITPTKPVTPVPSVTVTVTPVTPPPTVAPTTPAPVTTTVTPRPGKTPSSAPGPTVTVTPTLPGNPTVTPPGEPTVTPPADPPVSLVPTQEPSIADFVERLYTIALNRESDPEGKAFWIEEIEDGKRTGADCAHFFLIEAPEFLNRGLGDDEFVEILYKTFFDRAAEPEGKAFWVGELKKGTKTRMDVINGFIDSTEWCNVCAAYGVRSGAPNAKAEIASKHAIGFATLLFTCCLGRAPEDGGLKYWSLALTNLEQTGCSAAHEFFTSAEFQGLKTSDEEYLRRLYTTFMDREPETSEVAYWAGEIAGGRQTRDSVLGFFGSSEEFTAICKSYGIERGIMCRKEGWNYGL